MADVLTGVTETVAAAHEEVSKIAQEYLIQQAKMAPLVTDYSSLAVPGSNSIALPIAGGFTVGDKGENTAVDAQTSAFTKDQIALDQHRVVQFLIEDISGWQSNVNVLKEYIMRATKDLALDMDEKIIAQLRLASASTPDHQIKFNDTVNEDVELVDILNARKLLIDQNLDPRECYLGVGSDKERDMLLIENFISAEKYGSNQPIAAGEIGSVYGMKVIVHTSLTAEMISWHPSAVGYGIQSGTRYQTEKDLANLATRHSLDYLAGFEVLQGGKYSVYTTETA